MEYGFQLNSGFGYQPPSFINKPQSGGQQDLYPWLNEAQKKWLEDQARNIPEENRQQEKQKLYEGAIKVVKQREEEAARTAHKNSLLLQAESTTDQVKKNSLTTMYKMGNLADAIKKKAWLPASYDDKEVIERTMGAIPNGNQLFMDYMQKGDDTVFNIINNSGQPAPEQKKSDSSTLQNIGEGMYRYAAWIPGAIAESGLLDKPLEAVVQGISKVTGLKTKNDKTFSEYSQESATGWDPNSAVAKGVETGLNVAETVAGVGASGAAIAKKVAKNKAAKAIANVPNIIAEPETKKAVQKAIQQGRLEESTVGKVRRILFGDKWAAIKPTKQIQQAADLVVSNIKKPASTPSKLYAQIGEVVNRRSDDLGTQLKQVELPSSVKSKTVLKPLKDNIQELTTLTDEFTNAERKKIGRVLKKLDDVANLDDVRSLRKERDTYFSEAVKQADDMSAPSTRKAQQLWKTTRNLLNDYLDKAAEVTTDVAVKQKFKDMSALFKAQENILNSASAKVLKKTKGLITAERVLTAAWVTAGASFLSKLVPGE